MPKPEFPPNESTPRQTVVSQKLTLTSEADTILTKASKKITDLLDSAPTADEIVRARITIAVYREAKPQGGGAGGNRGGGNR
jgi:hypothetical protein